MSGRHLSPRARVVGAAALCGVALSYLPGGHAAAAGRTDPPAAEGRVATEPPCSVTLPFILDHNRMIVEVELVRPDGSVRKALAWVDTGSESLLLAEPLAADLGFDVSGLKGGERTAGSTPPAPPMRLSGLPLRVDGVSAQVLPGDRVMPGVPAEANLPASVLRGDHVVFDYPARRLTIARPGVLDPRGVEIPCRVNTDTGLFLIAAVVDGDTVELGVDNGSAGTWVSSALTTEWGARHPDWPHAIGAAGSANFFGFPFESAGVLMRLPELDLGGMRVENIGLVGAPPRMFDWYSKKSAGPVLGFLGANVIGRFRLEIDFPNRMTYWEPGAPDEAGDLDIVGLTLRPEADGSFTIAGVVTRDGIPVVDGVAPGDKLIRVDGFDVGDATMGAVADALRGTPGSTRTLVVEREGKRVTVEAEVLRLP